MNDLQRVLKEATLKIRKLLYEEVDGEVRKITFKSNPVRMADGSITSDNARKYALFQSITEESFKWFESDLVDKFLKMSAPSGYKLGMTAMETGVTAMGEQGDYSKSHIGIYYEYGTGQGANTGKLNSLPISLGDPNPWRAFGSGQPIVSRSHGYWKDAGGNVRKSSGPGGKRTAEFVKMIGDYTEAYGWFQKAFDNIVPEAAVIYREALNSVNFIDYFHVKKVIDLRKRRG